MTKLRITVLLYSLLALIALPVMSGHFHNGLQHQHTAEVSHHGHSDSIDVAKNEHFHPPEFHLFHSHANELVSDTNLLLGRDSALKARYKESSEGSSEPSPDQWALTNNIVHSLPVDITSPQVIRSRNIQYHGQQRVLPPARAPPLV